VTTTLLNANQAAAEWSRLTRAPRPNRATVIRWCSRGCRGHRLRGERLGGRWYVTPEALAAFLRETNELPPAAADRAAGPARAAQVAAAIERLDAILSGRRLAR
jgi:hypothetical protein